MATEIKPDERYYNIIRKIEVEDDDVSFYFTGSNHPFSIVEFVAGTANHKRLSAIETSIRKHNLAERTRVAKVKQTR